MRVGRDLAKFVGALSGHKPDVGAGSALLVGHRPLAQVAVGPPRGHHGYFDVVGQLVEFLQFGRHDRVLLSVIAQFAPAFRCDALA